MIFGACHGLQSRRLFSQMHFRIYSDHRFGPCALGVRTLTVDIFWFFWRCGTICFWTTEDLVAKIKKGERALAGPTVRAKHQTLYGHCRL